MIVTGKYGIPNAGKGRHPLLSGLIGNEGSSNLPMPRATLGAVKYGMMSPRNRRYRNRAGYRAPPPSHTMAAPQVVSATLPNRLIHLAALGPEMIAVSLPGGESVRKSATQGCFTQCPWVAVLLRDLAAAAAQPRCERRLALRPSFTVGRYALTGLIVNPARKHAARRRVP